MTIPVPGLAEDAPSAVIAYFDNTGIGPNPVVLYPFVAIGPGIATAAISSVAPAVGRA